MNNTQQTQVQIVRSKQQVDNITGGLILIGFLYSQGLINKETYEAIQEKYGNNKNLAK